PLRAPGRTRPDDRSPAESHPKKAVEDRSGRAPPEGQRRFRSAPAPYKHRYQSGRLQPSLLPPRRLKAPPAETPRDRVPPLAIFPFSRPFFRKASAYRTGTE